MDPRFFLPCFHSPHALCLGHKRKEKNSVNNLPYGACTQLIRGICSTLQSVLHILRFSPLFSPTVLLHFLLASHTFLSFSHFVLLCFFSYFYSTRADCSIHFNEEQFWRREKWRNGFFISFSLPLSPTFLLHFIVSSFPPISPVFFSSISGSFFSTLHSFLTLVWLASLFFATVLLHVGLLTSLIVFFPPVTCIIPLSFPKMLYVFCNTLHSVPLDLLFPSRPYTNYLIVF